MVLTKVLRCLHKICWYSAIIAMLSLGAMILVVVVNVVLRYVFHITVWAAIQGVEYLIISLVFFGLAWTQLERGHVSAEFIVVRLPKKWQQIIPVIIVLASLVYVVPLMAASWDRAVASYVEMETQYAGGDVQIVAWPPRFVIAFGVTLYLITVLLVSLNYIAKRRTKSQG